MSSINKTENYNLSQFGNDDVPDWRTDYSGDMQVIDEELTRLNNEVTEAKKSVSDGKKLVATAITDKGVATEPTDTFATMAENIGQISGGGVVSKTNSTKGTFSNALAGIATTVTSEIQEG